jgi:hypothetical protein
VSVQTKGAKFITRRVGVQVPYSVGSEETEEDYIRKVAERGRNHCTEVMPARAPCPSSARERSRCGKGSTPQLSWFTRELHHNLGCCHFEGIREILTVSMDRVLLGLKV